MHQNRFRPGLRPRTPLGKLTALPQTPSWWGGGSPRPPQEPHPATPPRTFGLRPVPILSVFPALIVHSELKSVHPGFPVAFIF